MSEQRSRCPARAVSSAWDAPGCPEASLLGPSLQHFLKPITWLISEKLVISLFDIILFSKAASLHKGLGI